MTKISLLPNDNAPVAADILVGDQTSSNTSENFKLSDLATFFINQLWASVGNNIKWANNASGITPANGSNNFSSSCSISLTVAAACKALVRVDIGMVSSSDFEFQPQVYLDGTQAGVNFDPNASAGNASGRAIERGANFLVSIPSGTHTLSPGVFLSAGSGYSIQAAGMNISAIILGNVTA